jgi:hypothetical protein
VPDEASLLQPTAIHVASQVLVRPVVTASLLIEPLSRFAASADATVPALFVGEGQPAERRVIEGSVSGMTHERLMLPCAASLIAT